MCVMLGKHLWEVCRIASEKFFKKCIFIGACYKIVICICFKDNNITCLGVHPVDHSFSPILCRVRVRPLEVRRIGSSFKVVHDLKTTGTDNL